MKISIICQNCQNKHYAKGLCRKCYMKNRPKQKCIICKKDAIRIEKKIDAGPICRKCYDKSYKRRQDKCFKCGKVNIIKKLINNKPICPKCYEPPKRKCIKCGDVNIVAKNTNDGPICIKCYKIVCIKCGKFEYPSIRTKQGIICQRCRPTIKKIKKCSLCRQEKPIKSSKNGTICNTCYERKRRQTDEIHHLKCLLRKRVAASFRKYGNKIKNADEYGINYDRIIRHLGPCPGNREDYHIDHIFPLSAFDFTNEEHIKLAFAPENHQWLTKEKNLRKNAIFNTEEFEKYLNANLPKLRK